MSNNKFLILIFAVFSFVIHACSQDSLPIEDKYEEVEGVNDMTQRLFPNLIANETEYNAANKELQTSTEAQNAFDKWIEKASEEAMSLAPYAPYELNKDVQPKVQENANLINSLAISWLFKDKETTEAKQQLKKVTQLIYKWASSNTPTSHTPVEAIIMPIYEGYSIVRTYIKTTEREKIDQWIKKRADFFKNLNMGNNIDSNWNTIRLSFLFQYALILEDQDLYDSAVAKFKSHIELNLLEGGKSIDLVKRDAFAYHAYNMQFYARILKSVAMFKGKDEAIKLYKLANSKGGSVEKSVQYWEPFLIDPENNIHLEFVNTSFNGDKSRGDYNKPYNPSASLYVMDELRYIEPKCTFYIETVNSGTRYNRNFKYWMNSVQSDN